MIKRTIIIAEAGVNHNGDISLAKKLIDVAAESKVDYVKFQTFKAKTLVSKTAKKAEYQTKNIADSTLSQYEMLKKFELSDQDHNKLKEYCKIKGVRFLSTAFDTEGVKYLDKLGVDFFKIPSGEITNFLYLKEIAQCQKKVVMSTGTANLKEIRDALEVLTRFGVPKEDITIMHCNSDYPTKMEDVNLRAMLKIRDEFGVKVGYSDHTLGIEVPIAAVAMGANVIEKHFTLDRELPGPDHKSSLEPEELKSMVLSIRNIEKALSGTGVKNPTNSELKNKDLIRKSIFIEKAIPENHKITLKDIALLRPGDGISPMRIEMILGKKTNKDLPSFHKLCFSDLR